MPQTDQSGPTEYSPTRETRHGGVLTTSRLRTLFFAAAALWGFAAGIGAVAVGLSLAGTRLELTPQVLGAAIPGSLLALAGGVVAAGAYREARDRRKR